MEDDADTTQIGHLCFDSRLTSDHESHYWVSDFCLLVAKVGYVGFRFHVYTRNVIAVSCTPS